MSDVALQRRPVRFSMLGRFAVRAPMFPLFALGCVLLIVSVPWLHLTIPEPEARVRKLRSMARFAARGWFALLRRLDIVAIETRGELPVDPGLLVANHPTLIDVVMLIAQVPDLCCVMKSQLRSNGLLHVLARHLGYVSNRDTETMLAECQQRLENGEILLIFPEATRSTPGSPPAFRTGAAELVLRTGGRLTPVIIHANSAYLSKSSAWYDFPPERLEYRIEFRAPYLPCPVPGPSRRQRRELTARLEALYREALGHSTPKDGSIREQTGETT